MPDGGIARHVLAAAPALLADLDTQIEAATVELAPHLPTSPFQTLTTVPGWGMARAGNYAAAVGDPGRWPGPKQLYRAAGLNPIQYEPAGKGRDSTFSREGSVELRRALIDLGLGVWLNDPVAKQRTAQLRARGNNGSTSSAPWHTASTGSRSRSSVYPPILKRGQRPCSARQPDLGRWVAGSAWSGR